MAVAAGIAMSFVIPYAPGLMKPVFVVRALQVLFVLGCLIGCYRLYRRLSNPYIRQISSPDDIFSVLLLTVWMFVSIWAAPNRPDLGEGPLMVYFLLTALFLIYVPFSKISHYPVLSLHPILLRQNHGIPGSLSPQAESPGEPDVSLTPHPKKSARSLRCPRKRRPDPTR